MSDYKYGEWYCNPANEDEAKEIVERAVSSGALLCEDVGNIKWDEFGAWGVIDGHTYTGCVYHAALPFHGKTQYTIAELRQKFPLPGECVEPESWNGEGLPPVGTVCELSEDCEFLSLRTGKVTIKPAGEAVAIAGHAKRVDNKAVCVVMQPLKDMDCGFAVGNAEMCVRPLRTEREKWVDAAHKIANDGGGFAASVQAVGALYDAIKSGQIKAPEAE